MQRFSHIAAVLLPLLFVFALGCGGISSMLKEPEWTENYALAGECDIEQFNDGSMYTTATTHPPEYIRGQQMDDSRFTDTNITLKEPKDIRRIVVRRRSEDSIPVDLDILAMVNGELQIIKEVRGVVKDDIDVRVKVVTDQFRIRAQRATRTAGGKVAITKSTSARGRARTADMDRVLREPPKFAEIELYGFKSEEES
jgi:HSP20 family molecular chaperone IbpA